MGREQSLSFGWLLAGAGSGIVTKTSVAPLERIKILFQVQNMSLQPGETPKYGNSMFTAARVVWQESGVRGFYKGNGANVMRVIPVYALKFSFNDSFRLMLLQPGQSLSELNSRQLLLAGTLAGLFQTSVTYPLEVIRTRLSIAHSLVQQQYRGILHCAQETVAKEGVSALYKGIGATFVSGSPYVGLQMTTFELLSRSIPRKEDGTQGSLWLMACGAISGLLAQTITFPGDTVRRRMQTNGMGGQERIYTTTWDCCRKLYAREGAIGFFRGWTANAARGIPGAAIQFTVYSKLKARLVPPMSD